MHDIIYHINKKCKAVELVTIPIMVTCFQGTDTHSYRCWDEIVCKNQLQACTDHCVSGLTTVSQKLAVCVCICNNADMIILQVSLNSIVTQPIICFCTYQYHHVSIAGD